MRLDCEKCGLGRTFEPYLLNLINGELPMFASHFIGGGLGDDPPSTKFLHEVEFMPPLRGPVDDELLLVRIRLFSNYGMPNHYAVVGSRWRTRDGSASNPLTVAR